MAKAVLNQIAGVLRNSAQKVQTNLSDSELLERFRRNRDEEAFATFVQRHGRTVLAACRQVLADRADIEDAFQAVFLVLLRKIASINGATVGSWLFAVAHRVAVRVRSDARRRTKREGTAATQRQIEESLPDLSWREAVAILHEELDRMPDAYRRVLLLCYLNGQSREEAAANLGSTVGVVKGRLERGRKMLTGRLARRGITMSAGLLAVATGEALAIESPTPSLLDQTMRTLHGATSPKVSALARGVIPMTGVAKKTVVGLAALSGLAILAAVCLADPPQKKPENPAPASSTPEKTPPAPEKKAEKLPVRGVVKDSAGTSIANATVFLAAQISKDVAPTTTKTYSKVVDEKGQPAAGREVQAKAISQIDAFYPAPSTKTNKDGTFELKYVRAAKTTVQVSPYYVEPPPNTIKTLTLKESEVVENVVLVVTE